MDSRKKFRCGGRGMSVSKIIVSLVVLEGSHVVGEKLKESARSQGKMTDMIVELPSTDYCEDMNGGGAYVKRRQFGTSEAMVTAPFLYGYSM